MELFNQLHIHVTELMSEITNLKTLLAFERLGNYQLVADYLHISQPAVTKRIKSLEVALGTKLVQRSGKRLVLSPEAKAIIDSAQALVNDYERLLHNTPEPSDFKGRIIIGAVEVILRTWFSDFLTKMQETYPNASLEVQNQTSKRHEEALLNQHIDIALMLPPKDVRNIVQYPAGELKLAFFASKNHSLPATENFITFPENSQPYWDLVNSVQKYPQFNQTRIVSTDSIAEIFLLTELGLGIGVAPLAVKGESQVRRISMELQLPQLRCVAAFLKVRDNIQFRNICKIAQNCSTEFSHCHPEECLA